MAENHISKTDIVLNLKLGIAHAAYIKLDVDSITRNHSRKTRET